MQVGIITFDSFHGRPNAAGSSILRGEWLVDAWEDAEIWSCGKKFDALIFQKAYWKEMMNDFKGIKILDMCDPDWSDGMINIVELSKKVGAITTSTEMLKQYLEKMAKCPVYHIPDRVNMRYFPKQREHTQKAKTVVWFGYYHNAKAVLPQVLPSLKSRGLNLLVVSNSEWIPDNDFGVEITNTVWTRETAYVDIQRGDFSINPNPFIGNFKYKSNNKTLISWALGLPVADTAEDMDNFIHPEKRNKEIKKRIKEIQDKWTIDKSIKQYEDIICNLQEKNEKK